MIKFDVEKVLFLHQLLNEQTGGDAGLRDANLLDSALQNAFNTFDGKDLYPSKEEKAANLGFSLVNNHAFVDGNKRIGIYVMLSFLELNGVHLKYSNDEIVELGFALADGTMKQHDLLKWINSHKDKTSII